MKILDAAMPIVLGGVVRSCQVGSAGAVEQDDDGAERVAHAGLSGLARGQANGSGHVVACRSASKVQGEHAEPARRLRDLHRRARSTEVDRKPGERIARVLRETTRLGIEIRSPCCSHKPSNHAAEVDAAPGACASPDRNELAVGWRAWASTLMVLLTRRRRAGAERGGYREMRRLAPRWWTMVGSVGGAASPPRAVRDRAVSRERSGAVDGSPSSTPRSMGRRVASTDVKRLKRGPVPP